MIPIEDVVLFNVIDETSGLTVTVQVAVLLPSAVLTVIVALPALIADICPFALTVATAVLLLLQDMVLLFAQGGTVAPVSVMLVPIFIVAVVCEMEAPVTGTLTKLCVTYPTEYVHF